MKTVTCTKCNRILYIHDNKGDLDVEVICPGCRKVNYPHRLTPQDRVEMDKGIEFIPRCLNHICCGCHRLLFRSRGIGYIEVRCKYCKALTIYDTKLMREGKWKLPETEQGKKIRQSLAK